MREEDIELVIANYERETLTNLVFHKDGKYVSFLETHKFTFHTEKYYGI